LQGLKLMQHVSIDAEHLFPRHRVVFGLEVVEISKHEAATNESRMSVRVYVCAYM
jgi:hypothetical protein